MLIVNIKRHVLVVGLGLAFVGGGFVAVEAVVTAPAAQASTKCPIYGPGADLPGSTPVPVPAECNPTSPPTTPPVVVTPTPKVTLTPVVTPKAPVVAPKAPVVHQPAPVVHQPAPVVHQATSYKRVSTYKAPATKATARPVVTKVTTCKAAATKVITRTITKKVLTGAAAPVQGFPWWAIIIGGAGAIALRKLIVGLAARRKNKAGANPDTAAN